MRELKPGRDVTREVAARRRAARTPPARAAFTPTPIAVSSYVQQRMAAWRLLQDLPFAALVPDPAMLPPESIRFCYLDPAWLDALTEAALSLGCDPEAWEARRPVTLPLVLTGVLSRLTLVRDVTRGRLSARLLDTGLPGSQLPGTDLPGSDQPGPQSPPQQPPITGFLLRSALVSGWPGTQVRGWTTQVPEGVDSQDYAAEHPERVVRLLRIQRLSPAVLLVLFAGVPKLVWIEEPHHGIQLGVNSRVTGPGPLDGEQSPVDTGGVITGGAAGRVESRVTYTVEVRDSTGQPTGDTLDVPMRAGLPGLVDVARLADDLDDALPLDAPRGGAAMALALLQPPARQRFSATAGDDG